MTGSALAAGGRRRSARLAGGRLFRPAGAPAGVFPHKPWQHHVRWEAGGKSLGGTLAGRRARKHTTPDHTHVSRHITLALQALHDPYERINVWSHALPGLAFLALGLFSLSGLAPEGALPRTDGRRAWTHDPLGAFCLCAATTHLLSALTHVWPDSARLEKADHVGIVVLIAGTPLTAWAAHAHGALPRSLAGAGAALLLSSALPPAPRVAGFVGSVVVMVTQIGAKVVNWNLGAQLALYGAGAAAFLRNGGHGRGGVPFLTDHHALHYCVTVACCMHVAYLVAAMAGVQDKG